ncbi:MerR family transcriptional regulator [Neobacillus terrae]|uniref:MerR family transcriptional regulator n=1 Tax=Neobacillus terrae TaxID=3034837 RepID=UPI001408B4BB|nr:MerR family transcriptional regulator [Neobacillus terrae]NHM31177.1 MerR family transcriptional regulator [Neobacillus terrae]
MNTAEVSKLLGVSQSTIQRWVKQLELPMERNERGHYHFNDEDIEILKTIQDQVQNGTLLQEIAAAKEKKSRIALVKKPETDTQMNRIFEKINDLERRLNEKADSVTSYQLLQHRREIEDLQEEIKHLTEKISFLESSLRTSERIETPIHEVLSRKPKKRKMLSFLFGF